MENRESFYFIFNLFFILRGVAKKYRAVVHTRWWPSRETPPYCKVGGFFISFLTSVVAFARLASVFSRLVERIWSAFSSLVGQLGGVLFGRRDRVIGLFRKRDRRWALTRIDSSWWASLTGCMTLRYAKHRHSSIEHRGSRLGGKALRSCSPGWGRKLGAAIVCTVVMWWFR